MSELVRAFNALTGETTTPFHLDLLTPHSGNAPRYEELSESLTVHRVETPSVNPLDLFNSVVDNNRYLVSKAKELHDHDPYSLIHVHDWLTASAGIELKHDWKIPLVTTIHATERGRHQSHLPSEISRNINQLEWQVCFESWRLIVCSSYMAGELRSFFDVPLDKVTLHTQWRRRHAISGLPGGPGPRTQSQIRAQWRKTAILHRTHHAGERRAGTAAGASRHSRKHPNVRLIVAGRNSEQLQPLVDELGIREAVELMGFIDSETRDCLYRGVDAAVFPVCTSPLESLRSKQWPPAVVSSPAKSAGWPRSSTTGARVSL